MQSVNAWFGPPGTVRPPGVGADPLLCDVSVDTFVMTGSGGISPSCIPIPSRFWVQDLGTGQSGTRKHRPYLNTPIASQQPPAMVPPERAHLVAAAQFSVVQSSVWHDTAVFQGFRV